MKQLLVLLLCLLVSSGIAQTAKKKKKKTHKKVAMTTQIAEHQLCGKVLWKAGNMMPSPDRPVSAYEGEGVERTLYVYALTNVSQTLQQGRFYANVQTKLVKTIQSDKTGAFCVSLPEGTYSIFSMETGKGLYANSFDDAMNIAPIMVKKGENALIKVVIDYAATY